MPSLGLSGLPRIAAAATALVAWTGLAVQFDASLGLTGSFAAAAWAMLRYFTVITNLLVALAFTGIALGAKWPARPFVLAGLTLAILLVGIVHALLLRGLVELSSGAWLADILLHRATPLLVSLYWLAFAPRRGLRHGHALLWTAYPLAYFAYALVRGGAEGHYAYPFLDVADLGWPSVATNGAGMALAFVAGGLLLVMLSRRLTRH